MDLSTRAGQTESLTLEKIMDTKIRQEDSNELQNSQDDEFQIFEMDKIDQICLQHDQ